MTFRSAGVLFVLAFLPLSALSYAVSAGILEIRRGLLILGASSLAVGILGTRQGKIVPRGRRIGLTQSFIQQHGPEGNLVAEIDAAQKYEYQLDRLGNSMDAIVRLYQGNVLMEFYLSDPGAAEVREEALGFAWPPSPTLTP